ncbi:hypothetical protein [Haladaptatus sp. NG-SE-30]
MVRFKFDHVIGNWWTVTVGRSLDDIGYTVIADSEEFSGGLYRLETLIALYESARREHPTADHPMDGGYTLTESDGQVFLVVNKTHYETSYPELEQMLRTFLGDVFHDLDSNSTPEQQKTGIDFFTARDDLLLDFRDVYTDLA